MRTTQFMIQMILILFVSGISAQEFQGIATYKSKRKVDIKLDSTKVSDKVRANMMSMLSKQFEKTFELAFNKEESIYREREKLEKPNLSENSIIVIGSGGEQDILYKNLKENLYINQKDLLGKIFLIKDELKKIDWKLHSDVKNIGIYTCYKATTTIKRQKEKMSFMVADDHSASKNETPEMENVVVTTWYTLEIPVGSGPGNYHGLPGLILEVNDGVETVICSQIILNPEKKTSFIKPKKGKKVNQSEFDKIAEKKKIERLKDYKPEKTLKIKRGD